MNSFFCEVLGVIQVWGNAFSELYGCHVLMGVFLNDTGMCWHVFNIFKTAPVNFGDAFFLRMLRWYKITCACSRLEGPLLKVTCAFFRILFTWLHRMCPRTTYQRPVGTCHEPAFLEREIGNPNHEKPSPRDSKLPDLYTSPSGIYQLTETENGDEKILRVSEVIGHPPQSLTIWLEGQGVGPIYTIHVWWIHLYLP